MSENELLCEQQYGFRSQHSTELAAIKLVDYLTHKMNTNKMPTSIYLDLSKAFDTLSFQKYISENVTLTVGGHNITQSTHIRRLGVRLDAELTIEPQITDMCKTAYYHIKNINKIRKYLTDDTTKTNVHSLRVSSDRSS